MTGMRYEGYLIKVGLLTQKADYRGRIAFFPHYGFPFTTDLTISVLHIGYHDTPLLPFFSHGFDVCGRFQ
jgi:hypothetical protein